MPRTTAIKGLLGIAAIVAMSACSGAGAADESSATTDSSQPTAHQVTASQPFLHAEMHNEWVVTLAEQSCIDRAGTLPAKVDCAGKASLIATQVRYLRDHSHANTQQITCAERALDSRDVEEIRGLADTVIGKAAYLPCGVPA